VTQTTPLADEERAELEYLRAHAASLEAELREQARRTNAAIAAAQERAYWLDRWQLDLNALMRRRGAAELRAAVRLARRPVRFLRNLKRRLVASARRVLG
jgi:hypothetical protein